MAPGPAVFDRDVLALYIASIGQPLAKCGDRSRRGHRCPDAEEPDDRHFRLCGSGERSEGSRATKESEEIAPPHFNPRK